MADSQQAEVKIKWVFDTAGAVRATDAVTGSVVKLAKEEEEVRKRIERTTREMEQRKRVTQGLQQLGVIEGPAAAPTVQQLASRAEQAVKQQQAVREELIRRGVIEGPKAPAAPLTVQQEAAQRAQSLARSAAVEQELIRMGVKKPGQAASPFAGTGQAALGGLGFPTADTPAAGVAAAIAATKFTLNRFMARSAIEADPYLSDRQRAERRAGTPPVLGDLYEGLVGLTRATNGVAPFMGGQQRLLTENQMRATYLGQIGETRSAVGFDIAGAKAREEAFRGYRSDRLPGGIDRGTVAGQRLFEEELRLLPARQELTKVTRDRVAAERLAATATARAGEAEMAMAKADRDLMNAKEYRRRADNPQGGITTATIAVAQQAAVEENRMYLDFKNAADRNYQAAQQKAQSERELQAARAAEVAARAGVSQGMADLWSGREQTAAGQARNLAALGPEGRLRGQLSLQLLDQLGYENAPAELQGAAAAYAPQTVGKRQEAAGEQLRGEARGYGQEEFRYGLAEARGQADKYREETFKDRDAAIEESTRNIAQIFGDSLRTFTATLEARLREAIANIEREAFLRNNISASGGSF